MNTGTFSEVFGGEDLGILDSHWLFRHLFIMHHLPEWSHGNRCNFLHILRVESFSVLSFESTLGENRPAEIHIETSITTNFLFQLAPDFQKKVFDKTHQNQAASCHGSAGGSRIFWAVSVWYHRCSKDDDQQQFGASIGCLCPCLKGWNDFLPIRELFSISSILKTPLLFVFPGRHLQFSIWECVFFAWSSPLNPKKSWDFFSTTYKNITKITNASFCNGRC